LRFWNCKTNIPIVCCHGINIWHPVSSDIRNDRQMMTSK
jgi:hypothetical protein